MRINGRNRLACKVLIKDVGSNITVEPMLGLPVIKDLIVDMEPFFDQLSQGHAVHGQRQTRRPTAANGCRPPSRRARLRRHDQMHPVRRLHHLLPITLGQRQLRRPGGDRQAHRFIFDSRDHGAEAALEVLNEQIGVWRCRTIFNCTEACPRGIQVTHAIEQVKRTLLLNR